MLDSSNQHLHMFSCGSHLHMFVMMCPSSAPSGSRMVGGATVPRLSPRGRHSLSGHCGTSDR